VDLLLDEYNWFKYDEIDDIKQGNNVAHAYFYNKRIEPDIREEVAETL